jgi:hypothetical protein
MAPIIENSTVDGIHERPGAEPSAPAPTPIRPWVGRQVLTLEQRVRAPHRRRDRGVDGDMAGFHPAVAGSTPAGRSRLGAQLTAGCLILVQVMVRVRIPRPQLARRGSPNGRGAELKPPSLRVRPPLSALRPWRVRLPHPPPCRRGLVGEGISLITRRSLVRAQPTTLCPDGAAESASDYESEGRRFESCSGHASGRGAAW